MFTEARTVFRVFGFDIRVDPSWILIAALITWSLATHIFPVALPAATPQTHALMGLLGMLVFFASLIAHELAHATVARRYGVETRSITLFLFGGVAELTSEPGTPRQEFWIAIAGPVMSFAIALALWMLAGIGAGLPGLTPVVVVLTHIALINALLAVFNLLPAFPLDGGRILRAWLWKRRGDILSATETAGRAGSTLAYALILLGMIALFQSGLAGGLWQILIGLFLLVAARSAVASQRTRTLLEARAVRHLMTAPAITVDPGTSLARLVNQIMLRHRISFVPVVEDGTLLGHITTEVLTGIDRENWASTQTGDVFINLDEHICVPPDMPAVELFERMVKTGERKFMVVDNRRLLGVVSLSDTVRLLGLMTSLGSASATTDRAA